MSWKNKVKNWDGKLYKVLQGNKSCHGGDFEWSLPEGDKPGDWTPTIEDVKMCKKGYHLTTHYAHWSDENNISIYEAEGDVVEFDGYDKVVCTKARLLKLVENPFDDSGNRNSGICNSGNYNSGNYNSGNYNSGNANSGNYNSGNNNPGSRNSGNDNLGSKNSGYCNCGNHNSGYNNFGSSNSGDSNYGNNNSGDNNLGSFNSGNWNSGSNNAGFLCVDSPPIMLFDKPVPIGWKPRFPRWMYFKILSKGYRASWRKAFENADIEGIKELLFLPNFDYKIFEKISSITKEQIEEKLC